MLIARGSSLPVEIVEIIGCYKGIVDHAKVDTYSEENIDPDDIYFCRLEGTRSEGCKNMTR